MIGYGELSVSSSRVVRPAAGPRGAEGPRRREGSGAGGAGAGVQGPGPHPWKLTGFEILSLVRAPKVFLFT